MRELHLPLLLAALISAGPINAGPRCADLALVLAVDTSGSIDEDEFRMQVDVASVFWADSAIPPVIINWTRIKSAGDAVALADSFLVLQRTAFGDTDLGAGLMAALDLLDAPGQCSARELVNVSGDGRATIGGRRAAQMSVASARARADAMGVTVNGLAILNAEPSLGAYYRTQVITGPGAFVMEARDFRAFGEAIVQKLEREIRPQVSASLDVSKK